MELKRRVARSLWRLALVGVIAYYAVWAGEYSAFDLRDMRHEAAAAGERVTALLAEVDSLRLRADALESDPAAIERLARERFGMIRDGEVLYRFVEVEPASEEAGYMARRP